MRTTGKIAALGAATLLAAGTLAGCGSDSSSSVAQDPATSGSPTPSHTAKTHSSKTSPTGPACTKVWKDGATLPHSYRGCTTDAGWVKAQVYECEDGHRLVTYAHAFYASPGRSISRAATTLAKDQGFRHTMAVCGA
ncbi:MAG TPA: hypothetical protein VGK78_05025 [Nocardioides sp.]|uniref:hypothetical protein n=1 Tax=Nocardioides sp. TaxID=35761 RepID=UPI002F3EF919